MAEYIEKEALLKRLDMAIDCKNCPRCVDMKTYYDRCAYTDIQDVCGVISDMPAADVKPVKRGRWIEHHDLIECNVCGFEVKDTYCEKRDMTSSETSYDYCPKCGADMRSPDATKG